jgi:hypothetical protein
MLHKWGGVKPQKGLNKQVGIGKGKIEQLT